MDNPGDYYDAKTAEAHAWLLLLQHAKRDNAPEVVIKKIQDHLDMARYVGD